MTVSEAITKSGITPSASYTGIETANDFVLAFQIDSTQTKESQWIVCADHVKEHSGSLNATTEDAQYIRTGNVTEKTGTQRTLAVNGDRCVGDAFRVRHRQRYHCALHLLQPAHRQGRERQRCHHRHQRRGRCGRFQGHLCLRREGHRHAGRVHVCGAIKAPVGLLSDRAVLRSKMEGPRPDKLDYTTAAAG